jgi:putative ABC transport system permease protein
VANLLLARATARQREVAIRAALGAGRWRIVRQLLTESVIVALAGGIGGALLAVWGTDLIWLGIPPESNTPYYITWTVDASTLIYTLAISVFVGVVFGLAPALEATKGNLQESLKEGGRGSAGSKRHRLRNGLVVAEVALSLILLVGASLFVRSFLKAQHASGGFDTAPIMTFRTYMPGDQYVGPSPKARRIEDVMRRIEALPGVVGAAASNNIPLSGGGSGGDVAIEGKPVNPGDERGIFWTGVTAHWFRTLDVPVRQGRDFTEREAAESSAVAVINQTMAQQFWANEDPLGRRFRFVNDTAIGWVTVIGVIPDIHNNDLDDTDRDPSAYLPYPYLATPNTGLMVRVAGGEPTAIVSQVRREIRAADPGMPLFEVQTMETARQLGFWQFKLFGWMFAVFGAIALLLAAVGVYGVLAYSVTQRTQEMGVRTALGASSGDVLRLVVGEGVKLAGIGIGIGLVGAFGVTRFISSILFDTSPSDPLSYAAVALFLIGVAVVASWIPARRATIVDPIVALRAE